VGGTALTLGLLVLVVGCSGKRKSAEYGEVSGRVFYKGSPLPGGRITFVAPDGYNGGDNIDEKGNYKISAPVGPVKIGVDNSMLLKGGGGGGRRGGGSGAPAKMPSLKRPGSEEAHQLPGRYVNIPDKYRHPDESGLTYTVQSGSQTHDVKLD